MRVPSVWVCARGARLHMGSSPGEKLSLVAVVVAEAVGRWSEVERGPAFHNSAVGRVGRATADQAVENRVGLYGKACVYQAAMECTCAGYW